MGETTPTGAPTKAARLGAVMTAEFQAFVIEWGRAWVRAHTRSPGK